MMAAMISASRRVFAALLLLAACMGLVTSLAMAQTWPARPVRVLVPFPAGSSPDVTLRIVAPRLAEALGQPVVVENRGGAAGIIGAEIVARAAPDGYTLLYPVNSVICANEHLYSKLPYDPLKSFVPVTMTVSFGYVLLARTTFPVNDLRSLIAMARAEPGKLNFGSAGLGAGNHVVMEMLLDMTGTRMVHIPNRDSAVSVASGESDISMVPSTTAIPLVRGGRTKAFGVTLPARLAALPDVPAIGEVVPGYAADAWHGFLAPAGTPTAVVDRIAFEVGQILRVPEVAQRLRDIGLEPVGDSPAHFAATVRADYDKWGKAIRSAGIRLD